MQKFKIERIRNNLSEIEYNYGDEVLFGHGSAPNSTCYVKQQQVKSILLTLALQSRSLSIHNRITPFLNKVINNLIFAGLLASYPPTLRFGGHGSMDPNLLLCLPCNDEMGSDVLNKKVP